MYAISVKTVASFHGAVNADFAAVGSVNRISLVIWQNKSKQQARWYCAQICKQSLGIIYLELRIWCDHIGNHTVSLVVDSCLRIQLCLVTALFPLNASAFSLSWTSGCIHSMSTLIRLIHNHQTTSLNTVADDVELNFSGSISYSIHYKRYSQICDMCG